jgi:hypothetical protein
MPIEPGANVRAFILLVLALTGISVLAEDKPQFKFTSKREDDRIIVKKEQDRTVFDITSPFGISEVVIERMGETWPDNIVVQLQLSGLEYFLATSEKASACGRVHNLTKYDMELTVDGKKEDPKDPKSANFMEFKVIGRDGKIPEKIPLQDGYFEMQFPKSFFLGNPKKITLQWVDFYRR